MPMMVAKRALYYAGQRRAGEAFEAAAQHARLLQITGKADFQSSPVSSEETTDPRPARRRYRRRDMSAEG